MTVPEARAVFLLGGQSNVVGADSNPASAPGDHLRHAATTQRLNASNVLETVSEPLHAGIDPYLDSRPNEGFAFPLVAINEWKDVNSDVDVVVVPCAEQGTNMATDWAATTGTKTLALCTRALACLQPRDRVVLLWWQGESEASVEANALAIDERTQATWNYIAARLGRSLTVFFVQLPSPGAAATYQATVQSSQANLETGAQYMLDSPSVSALHANASQHITIGTDLGALLVTHFVWS